MGREPMVRVRIGLSVDLDIDCVPCLLSQLIPFSLRNIEPGIL
jgi:hypothetical protein